MRTLIIGTCFALLILSACKKTDNEQQNVEVRFINLSDENLTNTEITNNHISIGDLDAGGTTDYISFSTFRIDSQMPDEIFAATIDGERYEGDAKHHWCGTEKSLLTGGRHTIAIYKAEHANENLLILRFQKD